MNQSNHHEATAEQVGYALSARLLDCYEWQNCMEFEEFENIVKLIGKAIAKSPMFNKIEDACMDAGIIESEYFCDMEE
jgi:hypothetical protein